MTQSRKKAGRWMRTGQIMLAFSVLAIILLQAMGVGLAAGNGSEEIIAHGTGLGGNFDTNLTLLAKGAVKAMHVWRQALYYPGVVARSGFEPASSVIVSTFSDCEVYL